jgi:regulator of PEP synthase PpsR (kinase-PPPase family)
MEQCTYELRRAEALYAAHGIPSVNSSAKSVEEMSTLIIQTLTSDQRPRRSRRETLGEPKKRSS